MKTEKIKKYIVTDNSYQQCLDDKGKNHFLAGCLGEELTELDMTVDVIVQPFHMKVWCAVMSSHTILPFIIGVDHKGLRHLILYSPLINY